MKFSFVVPAYNCEKYIEKCIESIISFSSSLECIVVDDGSTDNTGIILDKLAKKYINVFVYHTVNKGVSNARNFALLKCKGEYVTFVDSDDYINIFDEKMIDGDYYLYCLNMVRYDNRCKKKKYKYINNKSIIYNFINNPIYMNSVTNKFFKLDIIKNNKIQFNSKYYASEDLLFLMNYLNFMIDMNKIKYLDIDYYNYQYNVFSSTGKTITKERIMNNYYAKQDVCNLCSEMNSIINCKKLIDYYELESIIQFLLFPNVFSIKQYRLLNKKKIVWYFNKRIDYYIITICANIHFDVIPKIYIFLKKLIKKCKKNT